MQQKPLSEKTIVDNVLKWETGQINIDNCRIPTTDNLGGGALSGSFSGSGGWDRPWRHNEELIKQKTKEAKDRVKKAQNLGRWPANVIFDEEQSKYLDVKTGDVSYGNKSGGYKYNNNEYKVEGFVKSCKPKQPSNYGDSGGQSRFYNNIDIDPDYDVFYYNGKQMSEREKYNTHPTLKPLKLMELLVKLITPPNGIVLDPFQGSGTTQLQCINNNFNYILIELNKEYVEIQEKRIEECKNKSGQQQLF